MDSSISNLYSQILKLNDTISLLHSTNEKIVHELAVLKNVNTKLEKRIISLEKNQAKLEQYSQHKYIELSDILNHIQEDNVEKVVIDICHGSGLEIEPKDAEGCHCLPVSRYSRDSNKRVIAEFVDRKHPEVLLQNKKSVVVKIFLFYMFMVRSLFLSLFVLTTGISGVSAKTCKEEGKFTKSFALAVL